MTLGSEESSAVSLLPQACPENLQPIRVLFVDDDEPYREILAQELEAFGFGVRGFADGAALLDSLEVAADADVIMLDWSLPKTSGIDLLPQLRRHGVNLPVVFLTGRALTDYESLAFDRGALDFIDKARGVEVLARRLRRIVESCRIPGAEPPVEKLLVCGRLSLRPASAAPIGISSMSG